MDTPRRTPQANSSDDAIRWFAAWAEHYCSLFDSPSAVPLRAFARSVSVALSALYTDIAWFPQAESDYEAAVQETQTIKEDAERIAALQRALAARLGPHDSYRRVYDVYGHEQPEAFSLARDLAHIYHEIKHGLTEYQKATEDDRRGAIRY